MTTGLIRAFQSHRASMSALAAGFRACGLYRRACGEVNREVENELQHLYHARNLLPYERLAMPPTISAEILDIFRKFDTPTVCNVVELFDLRPRTAGYMDGRIQACYPKLPPMVGYASTATFRAAGAPRAGNVYSGMIDQVASFKELPAPPVVVFQDLDNPMAAATFGE